MKWLIRNNELLLSTEDGTIMRVSAMDIWQSEHDDTHSYPPLQTVGIMVSDMTAMPLAKIVRTSTGEFGKIQIFARDDFFREVPIDSAHESDHVIIDDSWVPFKPGLLPELLNTLTQAGLSTKRDLTLIEYLKCVRDFSDRDWFEDRLDLSATALATNDNPPLAEASSPLFIGTLYDYQRRGSNWLVEVMHQGVGAVLGDTMGLGKTIQVIKAVCVLLSEDPSAKVLIICPSAIVENWSREIAKFSTGISVRQHIGPDRSRYYRDWTESVLITTYDVARIDSPVLSQINWDLMVIDEAQFIKNPSAQRTLRIKKIPRRIGIAVTGTPFENHLADIWSIFDFCLPGFLGSRSAFNSYFSDNETSASILGRIVSPLLLRRRIEDVPNELPDLIKIPMPINLTRKEAEEYEALKEEYVATKGQLAAITNLRNDLARPHSDPGYISQEKYDYLEMVAREAFLCNEKMIVFADQFAAIDEIVRWASTDLGVPTFELDGRIPQAMRQQIVDDFSRTLGPAMLVCNPRVGGTGLNIVAANHVFHFSMQWNPAIIDQATARAYRRGQAKNVIVYYPYYASTIEEYMWDRVAHKRELASRAVQKHDKETLDTSELAAALALNPLKA